MHPYLICGVYRFQHESFICRAKAARMCPWVGSSRAFCLLGRDHCATPLDLILLNKEIKNLVISGIARHVAVESTVRDALNMGHTAYKLEDCRMSTTRDIHEWSIKNTLPFFGFVIDVQSYLTAVSERKDK